MNYTLIDMCDVGAELGRFPAGAEAAEVLLTALCLDRRDFDIVAQARSSVIEGSLDIELQGPLSWLSRLVCDEILDWTWQTNEGVRSQSTKAQAVCEVYVGALAAVIAGDALPGALATHLRARWNSVGRIVRSVDLGPNQLLIRRVLMRLASLDAMQRNGLCRAVDVDIVTSAIWVGAGTDARTAVQLTGRERPAAAAQLLLVRAFVGSGLPTVSVDGRVWAALSRLVHGLVVNDVLSDETTEALNAFWRYVFPERLG